jgi:putative two-component system response regulator
MTDKPVILIIDDEPVNLAVLSQLLSPSYQVRACKSGEQALKSVLKEPRPDLILLDVMMPIMDGYGVLGELRKDRVTRDIPVIFVTSLADEMDEEQGLELGAVDYITKPVKPAVVQARIRAHLEIKQARDRLKTQNVWLEAEVARRMKENTLIQDVGLCALAQLAETRDSDLGNHIARTQAYVETLARKLQSDPCFAEELDDVRLCRIVKASPLHDIGKIGIPDQILLKPGKLETDEWEIMKTHCRIGGEAMRQAMENATHLPGTEMDNGLGRPEPLSSEEWEILRTHCRIGSQVLQAINKTLSATFEQARDVKPESLAFFEVAQIIATSHHEKWDGTGYPEGLVGETIPLPARLMALADVFDALTSPRVYKKPWSTEEAAQFILEQKGKHFDPKIVEAFEDVKDIFENIRRILADSEINP